MYLPAVSCYTDCQKRCRFSEKQWIEVSLMTEMVISANTLPEPLFRLIQTEKVKVREANGEIRLTPIMESATGNPLLGLAADCTIGLRGILADCPEMSVDKFLERKRADKKLELEADARRQGA
jgi:hypothetical protein